MGFFSNLDICMCEGIEKVIKDAFKFDGDLNNHVQQFILICDVPFTDEVALEFLSDYDIDVYIREQTLELAEISDIADHDDLCERYLSDLSTCEYYDVITDTYSRMLEDISFLNAIADMLESMR